MGNNKNEKLLWEKVILETALDAQTDTFFIFDAKTGKAVKWNRAFRETSGYTDEEIAELPAPDSYYSPHDLKRAASLLDRLFESTDGIIELELICKNGDLIPTEYHASFIKDKNGEPQYIVSVGRNISSRKESESIVRDSEERFRSLSDASFDAIFFSDKGVCLEQNSAAEKMFGYSSEEAIGKLGTDWIVPEDRDLVMNNMLNEYELPYNVTALRKDGTTFPTEIQGKMSSYRGKSVRVTALRDITEQIKMEENLRLSEDRLRSMFQNHNAIMLLIHPKTTKIINANKSAEIFYGFSLEELQSMTISDINKLSKKKNLDSIAEVLEDKTKFFKFQHTLKNGDKRYVEVHSTPIKYQDHTVLFSIIHDVTDRIKAETELKEQSSFIDKIIDSSAISTWIADSEGTAIRANPACQDFFGATDEEILGKYNLFQDNVLIKQNCIPKLKEVFEKGVVANLIVDYDFAEVKHVDVKKSKHKIVNSIFTPILGEEGLVSNVICQTINLTEIKKAEKEILEAKGIAERYLQIAGSMFVSLNRSGEIILINEKVEEILGYNKAELIGKNWFDTCLPEEIVPQVKQVFNRVMHGEMEGIEHFENDVITRSGELKTISWYNSYIRDEDGEIRHLLSSGVDVTEIRKTQNELKKHREHLEELVKERTKELREKNAELEHYNKLFVGREFRIKELKEKVKELEKKLNS